MTKKSKDKQLWQFYWVDMSNKEHIVHEGKYIAPHKTSVYKTLKESGASIYGYRVIDNGQIVEA